MYTYIDRYSMDVVGMFPLKKDTPAVSYREGGGGRRYIKNWSNTSVYYTERKLRNKKRGRPGNEAIENQQESSVNALELPHTKCVCERNSENPLLKTC